MDRKRSEGLKEEKSIILEIKESHSTFFCDINVVPVILGDFCDASCVSVSLAEPRLLGALFHLFPCAQHLLS